MTIETTKLVREQINAIARIVAQHEGWETPVGHDFVDPQPSTYKSSIRTERFLSTAEAIWAELTGDRLDYNED